MIAELQIDSHLQCFSVSLTLPTLPCPWILRVCLQTVCYAYRSNVQLLNEDARMLVEFVFFAYCQFFSLHFFPNTGAKDYLV